MEGEGGEEGIASVLNRSVNLTAVLSATVLSRGNGALNIREQFGCGVV